MSNMNYLLTSESVTCGHPDKLCDYISDSILDECLAKDKQARVAIEVFTKGLAATEHNPPRSVIVIGGEVTMKDDVEIDYEKIARNAALEVGYNSQDFGLDAGDLESCEVLVLVGRQSDDISQGVNLGEGLHEQQGAGDQGIMYGFATNESEKYDLTKDSYMPLPILLAHKLTLEITKKRLGGLIPWEGLMEKVKLQLHMMRQVVHHISIQL